MFLRLTHRGKLRQTGRQNFSTSSSREHCGTFTQFDASDEYKTGNSSDLDLHEIDFSLLTFFQHDFRAGIVPSPR